MPFLLYYDKTLRRQAQWFLQDGSPIDKFIGSVGGISAISHRQFGNVAMSPSSPAPPHWNYDGAPH